MSEGRVSLRPGRKLCSVAAGSWQLAYFAWKSITLSLLPSTHIVLLAVPKSAPSPFCKDISCVGLGSTSLQQDLTLGYRKPGCQHVHPGGDTIQLKATMLLEFHKAGALLYWQATFRQSPGRQQDWCPLIMLIMFSAGELTLDLKCKFPQAGFRDLCVSCWAFPAWAATALTPAVVDAFI